MSDEFRMASWSRWGLSLEPKVYAQQNKEENDRMINSHNMVAGYLDFHPDIGEKPWHYMEILRRAEANADMAIIGSANVIP